MNCIFFFSANLGFFFRWYAFRFEVTIIIRVKVKGQHVFEMKILVNPPFLFSPHTQPRKPQKGSPDFFFKYTLAIHGVNTLLGFFFFEKIVKLKNSNNMLHKEENMKITVLLSSNFPGGIQDSSSLFIEHNTFVSSWWSDIQTEEVPPWEQK